MILRFTTPAPVSDRAVSTATAYALTSGCAWRDLPSSSTTTGRGVDMSGWTPVVYRGDGAWIGVMSGGRIGVGVEPEGRATLVGSGFVPMWPFMEGKLSACLDAFSRVWESFDGCDVSTPEELIESTVASAWASGRSYWMELAVPWVIEMAQAREGGFDRKLVHELLDGMAESKTLAPDLRARVRRVRA
ncbi:hypothetical protein [Saccharothrix algeriensis]|uniref:Uncharacterized protein n=1 Tax=Saccharothrix algeriensis TaxID=173560 RepID=A0ABS2SCB9_9PSEU|nr:hypothetical protein [Saccharothrix algeriensis]MBM7813902.1 hypothetical protein [Saccharothrix algeriensis]